MGTSQLISKDTMTSRDFCYWLQGHLELNPGQVPTKEQMEIIRRHLAMVFSHEIDPSFKDVGNLKKIHNPGTDVYCEHQDINPASKFGPHTLITC